MMVRELADCPNEAERRERAMIAAAWISKTMTKHKGWLVWEFKKSFIPYRALGSVISLAKCWGAGVCFCLCCWVTVCFGKNQRTAKGCTMRKAAIPMERMSALRDRKIRREMNETEM